MKKTLFVFLTLMLLCLSVFSADTNCNVYYNLANFSLSPVANSRVTVTPLWPLGSYNGQILSPTSIAQNTDANGLTTFSNIVSGYAYRVQLYPSGTTFTNVITVGVTGTVNGHDYIGNFAGQFFQYYYTSNLLAASFDPLGAAQQATNTIAAPAIVGLVTSNQIATINPSQIYPAVSVSGGQTNWAVSAITNAGIVYNGTTYAFVTNNNGGALTNISGSSVSGTSTITNGLATVSYVGSTSNALFNLIPYGTSDIYFSSQTNNFYIAGVTNLSTMIDAPPLLTFTNTILSWVNGTYFMNRIQTNYIRYISSATMDLYTYTLISGGGAATVTAHPEIWLYNTNNGGTTVRIGSAADVAYSNTIETPTSIAIPLTNTAYLNTALTNGTQILLRWYVTSTTGSPTWRFYVGGSYGSHLTVGGIIGKSLYNATLNSDQTFSGANAFTNTGNTFVGSFTGNGAGLTNLLLPYISIINSPWITTNSFTSLISSSNFVNATVTNGLTGNSNNFYGTFSSTAVVNKITTNSIITTNITINSVVVSGITNVPASPYDITESHYNGTYSWDAAVGSQGAWGKGGTNAFGYTGASQGGTYFGITFSTNYSIFENSTYVQLQDASAQWGVQSGTTLSGRYFTGLVSPVVFLFQDNATFQSVTFTLSTTASYTTNFTYITNYFNNVLNGAGIALAAASGNTNLLISNNDPWFTADKNPTLDVSGSVDQALVVKGSFYVTGTLNGNGGGLTNISGASGGGGATNLLNVRLYPYTQATNISVSLPGAATNVSQLTYAILATNNIYFVQPSNLVAGFSFLMDFRQDSTGGRTATWDTNFWKFPSSQILTMTTNAGAESLISCVVGQYATNIFVIQSLNFQ